MAREIAGACTNKQKEMAESEKQVAENTADDDKEHASITTSSQATSSTDDGKPQTTKEEQTPAKEEQERNTEDKKEDEKMEVDSSASTDKKGKCLKCNYFPFCFFNLLITSFLLFFCR